MRPGLIALCLALLVAGCSSGGGSSPSQTPGPTGTSGPTTVTGPVGTPSVATTGPAGTSSPTAEPVPTGALPAPTAVGSAWTHNNEPEQEHDSHPATSGASADTAWLSRRDPVGVNQALVPIGCSGLAGVPTYPLPTQALEGRYVQGSLHAVVLIIDYVSAADATAFMTSYGRDISSCPAPATLDARTPYTRVITVAASTDTLVRDSWTEVGADAGATGWHEVIVRNGSRVGLGDVEAAPGVSPDLSGLETSLRTLVSR